jgi:hypothetical protein
MPKLVSFTGQSLQEPRFNVNKSIQNLNCSGSPVAAGNAKCKQDSDTSRFGSYLLLRQLFAAAHLADLVALVVPTRGAISTVVLALTARAFTTSLALLLDGLLAFTVRDRGGVGARLQR